MPMLTLVDENLDPLIENQLNPGEKILWKNRPQQGFLLRRSDSFFIPLSVLLCGLSCWLEGWIINLLVNAAPILSDPTGMLLFAIMAFFAILCLPLVLIGLFLVAGRFFFDRQRRKKTLYVLSNQRVIIGTSIIKHRIRSIGLEKIRPRLEIRQDGRGTVFLDVDAFLWWIFVGPPWWFPLWPDVEVYQPPFLERIESPDEVFEMLKSAIASVGD